MMATTVTAASPPKTSSATMSTPAAKLCKSWAGRRAMMPPKMMIETPCPTPYCVVSSPIHTNSNVPAVHRDDDRQRAEWILVEAEILDEGRTAARSGVDQVGRAVRLEHRQRNGEPM